jgi:hypothetical protein
VTWRPSDRAPIGQWVVARDALGGEFLAKLCGDGQWINERLTTIDAPLEWRIHLEEPLSTACTIQLLAWCVVFALVGCAGAWAMWRWL